MARRSILGFSGPRPFYEASLGKSLLDAHEQVVALIDDANGERTFISKRRSVVAKLLSKATKQVVLDSLILAGVIF